MLCRQNQQDSNSCLALSVYHSDLLEDIRTHTRHCPRLVEFEQKIVDSSFGWKFQNGLFFYKGKIFIPPNTALTSRIAAATNNATHEGIQKTIHRLQREFYWQKIVQDVRYFIS